MDTTRNRSAILAQFLRAAVFEIRTGGDRGKALESIDAVAEQLENVANDFPAHSSTDTEAGTSAGEKMGLNDRVGEREPSTTNTGAE